MIYDPQGQGLFPEFDTEGLLAYGDPIELREAGWLGKTENDGVPGVKPTAQEFFEHVVSNIFDDFDMCHHELHVTDTGDAFEAPGKHTFTFLVDVSDGSLSSLLDPVSGRFETRFIPLDAESDDPVEAGVLIEAPMPYYEFLRFNPEISEEVEQLYDDLSDELLADEYDDYDDDMGF